MKAKLISISCFSVLFFSSVYAQDDSDENFYDDIVPKNAFTIELGLPNSTANKPYNSMMQGLVKVAPYYQFSLRNHLTFGIGANYTYFKLNRLNINEQINGGIHSVGGFVKVGYEKFHSMRFGTDIGLKLGYGQSIFVSDSNSVNGGPKMVNAPYVEPTFAVILTANEVSSFRFVVGYAFQGYGFRPSMLGYNSNAGYDPSKFSTATQYFTFGFGFTYYINQY